MKSRNTLLVGSRKGLFVVEQHAVGRWAVAAHHFAGEPVSQTLADARTGIWYAALRLGHFGVKLHKSSDRGKSWQEMTSPALPPKPDTGFWADDPTPWNVEMIWSLVAGRRRRRPARPSVGRLHARSHVSQRRWWRELAVVREPVARRAAQAVDGRRQ